VQDIGRLSRLSTRQTYHFTVQTRSPSPPSAFPPCFPEGKT
jgi:hypothetical protein